MQAIELTSMWMVAEPVLPNVFVAVTVESNAPTAPGVPEMTPVFESIVKPEGRPDAANVSA